MIRGHVSPLVFGCLWILCAAILAMLPMKRQMLPGLILLIVAPFLLVWIGWVHGWVWVLVGTFAIVSMFRNPLICFLRRALGRPASLPKDLEK